MAVNLSPFGGVGAQFLDNSGNVLTGGKIFTYSAGTTTPQTTYTTSAGNIPHSNPIILDASGRVPSGGEIWLTDNVSYKFVLADANNVLIATYDNINGINQTVNAENVVYNPPFTNGVQTNVEAKLAEYISVLDFGADPTGVSDSSVAIQNAINSAQGSPIYIPAGTYILDTPLELNFSTAISPTSQPATQLIGAGETAAILVNRSGDYAIKNTPTLAQTQQLNGVRFVGGQLSGFTLTTDGGSLAGSGGIQLASYWFANLSNLSITSTDTNAIYVPEILAFGSNPDKYSCGSLIVDNCEINANAEWAIKAEMYSITWVVKNCYIVNNTIGGIYTLGVGHQITDNSIAGNGSSSSTVGGIHLDTVVGFGAPENVLIRDNELDNNWGCHIYHTGVNCHFIQNRFIQSAVGNTGGTDYRNNDIAIFDPTISSACANNVIRNNSIRFDTPTTQTITVFKVLDVVGAFNNAFIDNEYSPSAYAINPTYVTKYDFPTTKPRMYGVERGIQIAGSDDTAYSYGQVVVTAVGASVGHTSTPSQIKLTGLYNPNISNLFTFDDATWTFTAPYSGQLRITSNNIYRPDAGAVNQVAKIYVYKNGVAYHTQSIPQGFQVSATDQNYTFDVVMSVSLGDDITLFAEVAAGTLTSISSTTSTTTFQML